MTKVKLSSAVYFFHTRYSELGVTKSCAINGKNDPA